MNHWIIPSITAVMVAQTVAAETTGIILPVTAGIIAAVVVDVTLDPEALSQ